MQLSPLSVYSLPYSGRRRQAVPMRSSYGVSKEHGAPAREKRGRRGLPDGSLRREGRIRTPGETASADPVLQALSYPKEDHVPVTRQLYAGTDGRRNGRTRTETEITAHSHTDYGSPPSLTRHHIPGNRRAGSCRFCTPARRSFSSDLPCMHSGPDHPCGAGCRKRFTLRFCALS